MNTKQVGKTPIVTSGSGVKAGQALAFIEQLGTFSPVEVRPRLCSGISILFLYLKIINRRQLYSVCCIRLFQDILTVVGAFFSVFRPRAFQVRMSFSL